MSTDDIKDKIQKILALANCRSATEAEAHNAMQVALKLLAEHNLDMSEVENQEEKEEDIVELSTDAGRQAWQSIVWNSLAELYFCRCFYRNIKRNGKNFKSFILVGRKSNVDVAKSVVMYLIGLGNELAVGDTLYRNSFKLGFSHRIYGRCIEEKAKATNTKSLQLEYASMAPAIIDLYAVTKTENENFLAAKNLKLRERRCGARPRDESGYEAGIRTGNQVSLTQAPQGRLK